MTDLPSIQLACGAPSLWVVKLHGGHAAEVWADSVSEENGSYVFHVLADVDGELPPASLVTGRTPSDVRRMILAVARFPKDAVSDIAGG